VLEDAWSDDHTIAEVAELFGVGTTFINNMLRLHREEGMICRSLIACLQCCRNAGSLFWMVA
jgi:hypothetical protein